MKYEYKTHYFSNLNINSGLNELGQSGWKLVQFQLMNASPQEPVQYLCILIREVSPTVGSKRLLNESDSFYF
jgi:hypothetical protein